jgi:AraC-like DNA-binding protein
VEEREVVGLEAVEDVLSQQYDGAMRVLPAGPGTSRMRLRSVELDRARLDRIRFDMAFGASGPSLGGLVAAVVRRGRLRSTWMGHEEDFLPGDVCITAQRGVPFTVEHHETEVDVVLLEPALVQEVLAGADGPLDEQVRFTQAVPVSPRAAERWRSTVALLRDQAWAAGPQEASPLVDAAASRLLAATTLATFPSTFRGPSSSQPAGAAHPRALRRAISYIDDNVARDVTLAEVAAAASVSLRALQLAFRRHLDTTPSAYLRRARLEQAHQELRRRSPEDTTVTAVAARWGFVNASRFAAHYREAFSQPPGRTLRD